MNQQHTNAVETTAGTLAPREAQVLQHIAAGQTYANTARSMGISVNTVDGYLRRIRAKTGLRVQAQLVRLAMELQL